MKLFARSVTKAAGIQRYRITMQQLADNAKEFPLIKAVLIYEIDVVLRAGSVVSFLSRNDYFKGPTI